MQQMCIIISATLHCLPNRQQEACTGSMLTVSMMPLLSLPEAFPASWDGVTASFMSWAVSAAASRSWLSSGSSSCKASEGIQQQCPCNAGLELADISSSLLQLALLKILQTATLQAVRKGLQADAPTCPMQTDGCSGLNLLCRPGGSERLHRSWQLWEAGRLTL